MLSGGAHAFEAAKMMTSVFTQKLLRDVSKMWHYIILVGNMTVTSDDSPLHPQTRR